MAARPATALSEARCRIQVHGQVQGVGFRPFVYRLATELDLSGWVRNDADGVHIEVQGEPARVQALLDRLAPDAPALARVETIERRERPSEVGGRSFQIVASGAGAVRTGVTPDSAVCADCLRELFDPAERRYRYAFINCTQCGPRYTITTALPYDRRHTSMARFALCEVCRGQYQDPVDRRFHAQPLACSQCGPQLALCDAQGAALASVDVIAAALVRLHAGEIVALKGLGGFHLACDARNPVAVARLRERKQRDEKPFALMAANLASVEPWVCCSEAERALALGTTRPIVLLRKRPGVDAALAGVAPGVGWLGVMLPYTPLQYLLFHEAAGRPAGAGWLEQPQALVLVMTSANPGGEPLVIDNAEARRRLAGIADGFVTHDRKIHQRCDDSVVRCRAGVASFVRRARGYTPQPIRLPRGGPSLLACGAGYKNTICLTRGDQAFVSQHIGDLDNRAGCAAWEEVVAHLMGVLQIEPEWVAYDLHPDLLSTRLGTALAEARGVPSIAVQHHHAHIAAVVAEHGVHEPVLGLALDGVGLGSDGAIWGGELLRVDESGFERLGGLRPLALPGGDRAAREPWRMAASVLHALGRGEEICRRFPWPAADGVRSLLEGGLNCPLTSSAGRLFDAAAGLLGVKAFMAFEGQAAMLLEGLAEGYGPLRPDPEGYRLAADGALDLLPLLARLADTGDAAYGAALFHATLAQALAHWVLQAARRQGLDAVVLGGGCFLNHRLSTALCDRLGRSGLRVYEARQLPPNDGGLSLGQAWVAMTVPHDVRGV